MDKRQILIAVIAALVLAAITGYAVRGYTHWETSIEELIDARNGLGDNLMLLEAGLEWERERGATEAWISGRAAGIAELTKERDTLTAEIENLESLPFLGKIFFGEYRARLIGALKVKWSLKRRESIVEVAEYLRECREGSRTTKPPE